MSAEALDAADICALHESRLYPPYPVGKSQLRQMYKEADSVRGEARYDLAMARLESARPATPPRNNAPKPLLSGKFLDAASGDTLDLSTWGGKIVIVDFWTTWCGSCLSQIPFLKNYATSIQSNPNIAFISVICDLTTWDRGKGFISTIVAAQRINYPVLVDRPDDPLNRRFNISWYPSTLVIGRDGKISLAPQGSGTWNQVQECVTALESRKN